MSVIPATDATFSQEIENHGKVIVKYYADWCGSCRLLAPKYKRLAADERFAGIAFLDVNAEHSPLARRSANVTNLPYFAVFHNGKVVASAATSKEEGIVALLEELLADPHHADSRN